MIYHLTTDADWDRCKDDAVYAPLAFEREGFIHSSTSAQLIKTANKHFKDHAEIWLLSINEYAEKNFIKYENLSGGTELYPHIYRKLPKTSIVGMIRVKKRSDGWFDLLLVEG